MKKFKYILLFSLIFSFSGKFYGEEINNNLRLKVHLFVENLKYVVLNHDVKSFVYLHSPEGFYYEGEKLDMWDQWEDFIGTPYDDAIFGDPTEKWISEGCNNSDKTAYTTLKDYFLRLKDEPVKYQLLKYKYREETYIVEFRDLTIYHDNRLCYLRLPLMYLKPVNSKLFINVIIYAWGVEVIK